MTSVFVTMMTWAAQTIGPARPTRTTRRKGTIRRVAMSAFSVCECDGKDKPLAERAEPAVSVAAAAWLFRETPLSAGKFPAGSQLSTRGLPVGLAFRKNSHGKRVEAETKFPKKDARPDHTDADIRPNAAARSNVVPMLLPPRPDEKPDHGLLTGSGDATTRFLTLAGVPRRRAAAVGSASPGVCSRTTPRRAGSVGHARPGGPGWAGRRPPTCLSTGTSSPSLGCLKRNHAGGFGG